MANNYIPGVRKIAVLRANALGDFIVALPALQAIKQAYPDAELCLLAKPWNKDYAAQRNLPVDRVIVVPPSNGVRVEPHMKEDPKELELFFAEMRREQFDIAIQMHGGGRNSNPFIQKLGAKVTVGMSTSDAPDLDRYVRYELFQHEVFRYLEVAGLIGAPPVTIEPYIQVTPEDIAEAKTVIDMQKPYIVIHPGASEKRRRWQLEKFIETADYFAEKGFLIVITGTLEEKDITTALVSGMKHTARELAGELSLSGLTGILSKASFVISNDTGPLHLARAAGAKTVGLYWGPNLLNWGPVTRKHHRTAISWDTACADCGHKFFDTSNLDISYSDCGHESPYISSIQTRTVIALAEDLLD